mmetsp:Transcript_104105/g.222418  ORF Transcript_104105/g.222418 Transcript_104105/m.222418 type:complete len:203 (+) Transcript_104105:345-953(+)
MLLLEDGILVQELVALGFADTDSSHLLVLDGTNCEGQGREALVHLRDKLPSLLRLQDVIGVHSPLVDGIPGLCLLALAFASRHQDIQAVDLVKLELELVDLLICGLATQDDPVAINDMLLQLMGEHSLHGLAAELTSDLGEGRGDRSVRVAYLDEAQRSLCGIPSRMDDVSPLVLDGLCANDHAVRRCGDEAIDVARHVDLH